MTNATKVTGTTRAWTTNKWNDFSEVQRMIAEGENNMAIGAMSFCSHDMSSAEDWIEVGTAEITITFFHKDELLAKELEGLGAQLQKVRAENHMRENAILEKISKLQALEYTA